MIILARCPDHRNPVPLVHYNEYGLIVGEQKAKYYRKTNLDLVRRKRARVFPVTPSSQHIMYHWSAPKN